jgi:hypothetical protein
MFYKKYTLIILALIIASSAIFPIISSFQQVQASNNTNQQQTTIFLNSNDLSNSKSIDKLDYTKLFNDKSFSITDIYENTKFIWDTLQLRRDYYGRNKTMLYFGTDAGHNINSTIAQGFSSLIYPYTMYRITGDQYYLNELDDLYHRIIKFTSEEESLLGIKFNTTRSYDYITGERIGQGFSYIKFPESVFFQSDEILDYAINYFDTFQPIINETFLSCQGLPIHSVNQDGTPNTTIFHLTWNQGVFCSVSQFYYLSHITGNDIYKSLSDNILEAIWDQRTEKNLIPRAIDVEFGNATISSVTHYDMAGLLNSVILAYILNGENKTEGTENYIYYELIDLISTSIAENFWNSYSKRWNYIASSTFGGESYGIPEMYSFYVDIALLAAHSITNNKLILTRAIDDFYTSFMGDNPKIPNGQLIRNGLVIHSPATHEFQSVFPANTYIPLIGALIFEITQDKKVLEKVHYHYHNLFEKHKTPKGYIRDMYSHNLQPYDGYNNRNAIIDDMAIINAFFALAAVILPSQNVKLDWGFAPTRILPTKLLTGEPILHNLNINMANNTVELVDVYSNGPGKIAINFCNNYNITAILVNNEINHYDFTKKSFTTLNGTHTYRITFNKAPEYLDQLCGLYEVQFNELNIHHMQRISKYFDTFQTLYREEIEFIEFDFNLYIPIP